MAPVLVIVNKELWQTFLWRAAPREWIAMKRR